MINRFKGLDLVDRVPEGLWDEVHNAIQEVVTKTSLKKEKCKKAKRQSEETLHIAEERRDTKGKKEREIYPQLNAEFQRITRRDKTFLSEKCKKYRKTVEWERLRDLSKKIGDTKRTFHAKMGSIKDRNDKELTEAERLRRGGKNRQKNCTEKVLTTQITTMVWLLT